MSAGSGSDTNTYSMVQRVLCGRPPLCAAMSLDFAALGIVADPFGVYCFGGIYVAGIIVYFFGGIYVYFLEGIECCVSGSPFRPRLSANSLEPNREAVSLDRDSRGDATQACRRVLTSESRSLTEDIPPPRFL